ncbi:hypothetical protein ACLMJK_000530 [Lecanora helva]
MGMNVNNSRLLTLPNDICQSILTEFLGRKFIHIAQTKDDEYPPLTPSKLRKLGLQEESCRHYLCKNDVGEQELRDSIRTGKIFVPPGREPRYYIPSTSSQHEQCHDDGNEANCLDLRVLRACRHLYEQAEVVLYSTNTFSFRGSAPFRKFFDNMNASQKRKLRKIHFTAIVQDDEDYNCPPTRTTAYQWEIAIKKHMCSLSNLTTLHLSFEFRSGIGGSSTNIARRFSRYNSFRNLPSLNRVTVVISDDNHEYTEWPDQFDPESGLPRWTVAAKNAFANEYEQELLDPGQHEFFEAEETIIAVRHRELQKVFADDTITIGILVDIMQAEFSERYAQDALKDAEYAFANKLITDAELQMRRRDFLDAYEELRLLDKRMVVREAEMKAYCEKLLVDIL